MMKKIRWTILAIGLVVWAAAVDAYAVKVAVMDMNRALLSVKEGKKAKSLLKKDWDNKQKSLKAKEAKIQKALEALKKQSMILDATARQQKEMKIRQEYAQLQQEGMQAQMAFQKRDRDLSQPIVKKMQGIISQISKKKKFDIVMNSGENSLLYFDQTFDITDEVIKLYDAKSKKKK